MKKSRVMPTAEWRPDQLSVVRSMFMTDVQRHKIAIARSHEVCQLRSSMESSSKTYGERRDNPWPNAQRVSLKTIRNREQKAHSDKHPIALRALGSHASTGCTGNRKHPGSQDSQVMPLQERHLAFSIARHNQSCESPVKPTEEIWWG